MAFSSTEAILAAPMQGQQPQDFTLGARRGLSRSPMNDGGLGNMRLRQTLRAYTGQPEGYGSQIPGQAAPMMAMGSGNPGVPMGAGLGDTFRVPSSGLMAAPISYQPQNMPAPQSVQAGPAPMPPRRPVAPPPQQPENIPYPPQRPGPEMGPGSFASVPGFNALAAAGNAQAYADQFAGGDLSKLAARTYRNDDGTMWNDYYLQNPGAA